MPRTTLTTRSLLIVRTAITTTNFDDNEDHYVNDDNHGSDKDNDAPAAVTLINSDEYRETVQAIYIYIYI